MNQVHDSFERSEYSDDIFAVLGRALTVATRFDASTKVLARLPDFKVSVLGKWSITDDEYNEVLDTIALKYKILNNAILSLNTNEDLLSILTVAREARNEFIHESTIGCINGFDNQSEVDISNFMEHLEVLVRQIIKGDIIISALISYDNKEPISGYPFSAEYEKKYVNWVMNRF
tara:strand:+ start:34559 stop:35083 length:525 start_codon:yes stop_codon:yes gene_type:complete